MKTKTKDQILKINDLKTERVNIPQWGTDIFVKAMTSQCKDIFEVKYAKSNNIRAAYAVFCVCDKDGKLLFDESDIDALGGKSASALSKIFDVATRINGYSKEDIDGLEKK